MELRLLSEPAERELFTKRLEQARLTRGAGFKETRRSRVGEVHLTYGNLYGLFDETSPQPEEMVAGFVMHDLGILPQTYPKPDMTHLEPPSVLELGELWSLVKGAGRLARWGCAILAALRQAQAMVVYPIAQPWDLTGAYKDFAAAGDLVEWPYARTLEGGRIWVQPMVLEGRPLYRVLRLCCALNFETFDRHQRIRFDNPLSQQPVLQAPLSDAGVGTEVRLESGGADQEANGAAQM